MTTTSATSVHDAVQHLITQIQTGNILPVFEDLYDDDVVMIEADGTTRSGKSLNRTYEKEFGAAVEAWHRADVLSVSVNEDAQTSAVEWAFELTFKGQSDRTTLNQVAVQYWNGAKITREKFYRSQV